AIRLAEEGFPVGATTAHFWGVGMEKLLKGSPSMAELSVDGAGKAPSAGERFKNPGLARALHAIAAGGKDAFYRGDVGAAVVRAVDEAGGVMSLDDLRAHES